MAAAAVGADRLAEAEQEVELSRQRLHDAHENVVKPLREAAAKNTFATLIAASLVRGHGNNNGGR
jgi:hypothetical protein